MRQKYMRLFENKGEKVIRLYILLLAIDAVFLKWSQNNLSQQYIKTYLAVRIGLIGVSFIVILGEILKTFGDRFEELVYYITNRDKLSKEEKKECRKLIFRFCKFIMEVTIVNCAIVSILISALHQVVFYITTNLLLILICVSTLIRTYFLKVYNLNY